MSSLAQIFAIAVADFRERTRRYSFWVFLVLIAYTAYLFVPALDAPYTSLTLGAYRGIYNSAWVGGQVSMLTVTMLSLVGFFFVRGSVTREMQNKTHELVASSSISNLSYLCGKALSNTLILFSMTAVLAGTSAIMQLIRAEDLAVNPLALLAPFVLIIAPLMLVVACLAVLFDSVKWLRGGVGNALFFFAWIITLIMIGINTRDVPPFFDFFGVRYVWTQMMIGCAAVNPDYIPWEGPHSFGFNFSEAVNSVPLRTFHWAGPHWSMAFLAGRLVLLAVSSLALVIAGSVFARFDDRRTLRNAGSKADRPASETAEKTVVSSDAAKPTPSQTRLSHLDDYLPKFRFASLLAAEIRLALSRVSLWWYLVAAGLTLAGLLTPLSIAYGFLLPAAWFWPLLIWSKIGCREELYNTSQLVQPTATSLTARYTAQWLSGFAVALLVGAFIGVRALLSQDFGILLHLLAGAAFISSLTMLTGAITGGRKLFEVLYTLTWYIGPLNKLPYADFSGSVVPIERTENALIWFAIAALLGLLGLLARRLRTIRN